MNILLAFITGLTTGGLSCLAVQGGLLASSLANQIEQDFQNKGQAKGQKKPAVAAWRGKLARPILAFLSAKLLAYTLLGFLLGLVGQVFQLSPITRAILQVAVGIFMLGTALRMLNVHPIFRYFAFEPPASLRRKLRKTAAAGEADTSLLTPVLLGFLTVLIPCGVTQAMMAVALGTANPLQGAALMFAFTLGTSPVFFVVAYFATQLGQKLEKYFMRTVAVVILLLAVITIDSGITLAGSPVSLTRWFNNAFRQPAAVNAAAPIQGLGLHDPALSGPPQGGENASTAPTEDHVVTIQVENYGYVPNLIHARAGVPIQLRLLSENVRSCSLAFVIPSLGVEKLLQSTGEARIDIPAQDSGSEMFFSCSMGMYTGTIVFDL